MIRCLRLRDLPDADLDRLVRRSPVPDPHVRARAERIVAEIRDGGDCALEEAGRRYGGSRFGGPRVPQAEIDAAPARIDSGLRVALETAIENVRSYHEGQIPVVTTHQPVAGVTIERRWAPLGRVGCYAPGGTAAYPSTVIMTVVPALVAGVEEIVVVTPAGPDGKAPESVLAAASLLGVNELYCVGGAQAIAALAFGTETIPAVDKIVGPGNAWVTAAKLAVYGVCDIDLPAGPSEVLVLADGAADARVVAIDLLCQAEHGPDSPALLITTDQSLPARVLAHIDDLLPDLGRTEILTRALANHGLMLVVDTIDEAVAFANRYRPEHVTVLTEDPSEVADGITAAGSVYVGAWSAESAGDYATGANHVLPTGGLAAAVDPLGVTDFGSWRQVQTLTRSGLETLAPTIEALAEAEDLPAHRAASRLRLDRALSGPGA